MRPLPKFSEKQLLRLFGVPLLEPLDAARRIHKLLRAREERMALGTDANAHVLARGPRLDDVATGAVDHRVNVLRMYLLFHVSGGRNLQEDAARCKPDLTQL